MGTRISSVGDGEEQGESGPEQGGPCCAWSGVADAVCVCVWRGGGRAGPPVVQLLADRLPAGSRLPLCPPLPKLPQHPPPVPLGALLPLLPHLAQAQCRAHQEKHTCCPHVLHLHPLVVRSFLLLSFLCNEK